MSTSFKVSGTQISSASHRKVALSLLLTLQFILTNKIIVYVAEQAQPCAEAVYSFWANIEQNYVRVHCHIEIELFILLNLQVWKKNCCRGEEAYTVPYVKDLFCYSYGLQDNYRKLISCPVRSITRANVLRLPHYAYVLLRDKYCFPFRCNWLCYSYSFCSFWFFFLLFIFLFCGFCLLFFLFLSFILIFCFL